jgi:inosine-uridine nucleoside N-ribohydrolase
MGVKVIPDTDIGSDIDDAVALAWLLANPDCELLGVTTVVAHWNALFAGLIYLRITRSTRCS